MYRIHFFSQTCCHDSLLYFTPACVGNFGSSSGACASVRSRCVASISVILHVILAVIPGSLFRHQDVVLLCSVSLPVGYFLSFRLHFLSDTDGEQGPESGVWRVGAARSPWWRRRGPAARGPGTSQCWRRCQRRCATACTSSGPAAWFYLPSSSTSVSNSEASWRKVTLRLKASSIQV